MDSLLKSVEDVINENSVTQDFIIQQEMEEFTITEDARNSVVMDRNTNVDEETMKKWKSVTVVNPIDGKEYNKHKLAKNFNTPVGVAVARGALSFDRNARVQGKGRYGQHKSNDGGDSSVARAFKLAEKTSISSRFTGEYNPNEDDTEEDVKTEIVAGDAIIFLVLAKKSDKSTVYKESLTIGKALLFGKGGKPASQPFMPFVDRDDWHVTVSVEETIQTNNWEGLPALRCTGETIATISKVDASACIVYKAKLEMFSAENSDVFSTLQPNVAQFARVFEVSDLELAFKTLLSAKASVRKSSTIIPSIKIDGKEIFVVDILL
mmetsp:Transcript_28137/g.40285  ORF Transcript_28137/g.40285 Transcript_28137/m.40285 type:complete len:322 (+) Transcript_28137:203-1168(+)